MARTKQVKIDNSGYYLVTKSRQSNLLQGLHIPDDISKKRKFIDIAELDLTTLDIPFRCLKDRLQEYNDVEISDTFFDVRREKSNGMILYHPLFKVEQSVADEYIKILRKLANIRLNNIKNGNNYGTFEDTDELRMFRYYLLQKILENNNYRSFSYDSIIGTNIIDEIRTKSNNIDSYQASREITREGKFRNTLSNYNQLRALLIEYLHTLRVIDYYVDRPQLENTDYTTIGLNDGIFSFDLEEQIPNKTRK